MDILATNAAYVHQRNEAKQITSYSEEKANDSRKTRAKKTSLWSKRHDRQSISDPASRHYLADLFGGLSHHLHIDDARSDPVADEAMSKADDLIAPFVLNNRILGRPVRSTTSLWNKRADRQRNSDPVSRHLLADLTEVLDSMLHLVDKGSDPLTVDGTTKADDLITFLVHVQFGPNHSSKQCSYSRRWWDINCERSREGEAVNPGPTGLGGEEPLPQ